jgi:hypothetical protein
LLSAAEHLGGRDDVIAARLWLSLGKPVSGAERIEVLRKAAAVFERCHDPRRLALANVNLAGGYSQTLQLVEAVAAIDHALAIFRQTADLRSANYAVALGFQASALESGPRDGGASRRLPRPDRTANVRRPPCDAT